MPVQIDQAIRDSQVVITHAGTGTVSAAALAGKIQLALPGQTEQWMVGRRIADSGIGMTTGLESQVTDFRPLLDRLASDTAFARAAQALASRHSSAAPAKTAERVADLIEGSLAR